MKKIYSLFAAAICMGSLNAQTLTQANNAPIIGDLYQTVNCTSVGINPGGNGPSQTWNYSSMTVLTTTSTNTGVSVASTGSASSYPSAGVAIQTGTANLFYSSTASNLNFWGGNITVGGQAVTMSYTTPAIYAAYPLSLGTTANGNIGGAVSHPLAGAGNFAGTSTVTGAGTGTLMLPGGYTFNNVLKVTNASVMSFTVTIGSGTYAKVQNDYYSPLSKYPLLSISNETIVSVAGTTTETVVTINNNYNTVGVNESANNSLANVTVYPNPAKDNINLNFVNENAENVSYQIINVIGQTVREQNIPSAKGETLYNVSLSGIESGIYFIKLSVGNKTAVNKITVQ
ncbi:MAG: T9SS type A sorting domain-containing protein [Sphingobacteriaceae bacterium]|nr:T9SS type A sorting domain-containing protein [Sphingobacteriaceae bacterium]